MADSKDTKSGTIDISQSAVAETVSAPPTQSGQSAQTAADNAGPETPQQNPDTQRPVWLVQYDRQSTPDFERNMRSGKRESWRIGRFNRTTISSDTFVNDLVVIWRMIDRTTPPNGQMSRGGIIGYGRFKSLADMYDKAPFQFEISSAHPGNPISRDAVLSALSDSSDSWPESGALKRLTGFEAEVLKGFEEESKSRNETYESEELEEEPEILAEIARNTNITSDRAETTLDLLDRAPLAYALAVLLNRIWEQQTDENSTEHKNNADDAAYILHIDAPWGGGKTTFANFIARILNPAAFGRNIKELSIFPMLCERLFRFEKEPVNDSILASLPLDDPESWPPEFANRRWIPITFNAWENQHVQPPWWNFYEKLLKGGRSQLWFHHRCWLIFRERWWRLNSPTTRRWLLSILLLGGLAWLLFGQEFIDFEKVKKSLGFDLEKVIKSLGFAGGGAFLLAAGKRGIDAVVHTSGSSVNAKQLGESDPTGRLSKHFKSMVKAMRQPLFVVIDDLDRCDPEYVVALLSGLMTIFNSHRVVYVLLGDKNWIEQSFKEVHADMEEAHKDARIPFGARFAEKAIQLSFTLPETSETARSIYLDHILVRDRLDSEAVKLMEFKEKIKSGEHKTEELVALAQDTFKDNEEALSRVVRAIELPETLKAAFDEETEAHTRHELTNLKDLLPTNPRRIKRIVNMIGIYAISARSQLGTDEAKDLWYPLVLWIILLSEYPKAFQKLCNEPEWADKALNAEPPALPEELTPPQVQRILKGKMLEGHDCFLNTALINELRQITPQR